MRIESYSWKELFRLGIMGRYQVTLGHWQAGQDAPPTVSKNIIALRWSANLKGALA